MMPFMHTVRFVLGMAMLTGGVVLVRPFAAVVLAARAGTQPATPAMTEPPAAHVMQAGRPSIATTAGGHAIPDARTAAWPEGPQLPMANGGQLPPAVPAPGPPPSPAPLPASGLELSPASPPLDGTYRSTVDIPPPPLLDVHAPPPLSAGWSVHDVAKPAAPSPAMQPRAAAADYVVRDGDDLTGIALRVYGHAGAATAIWTANRDRLTDPQVLPIGLALRLPPSWMLPAAHGAQGDGSGAAIEPSFTSAQGGGPVRGSAASEPGTPPVANGSEAFWLQQATVPASTPPLHLTVAPGHRSPQEAASVPSATAGRPATMRVGMGDSLESIAVRFYGDRAMASRIWLANRDRLRSPDLLVPGAELRLP